MDHLFKLVTDRVYTNYAQANLNVSLDQPQWMNGAEHFDIDRHFDAPAVVWVCLGGTVQPTNSPSPKPTQDNAKALQILYSDHWAVQAHIYGASKAEAECIRWGVLKAVHDLFGAESTPSQWVWETEEDHDVMHGGREKMVQDFTWNIGIPGDVHSLAQVAAFLTEGLLQDRDPAELPMTPSNSTPA